MALPPRRESSYGAAMSQAMPQVSVVVPVHDEEGAAAALAREIADALQGRAFEMIFVDDATPVAGIEDRRGPDPPCRHSGQ